MLVLSACLLFFSCGKNADLSATQDVALTQLEKEVDYATDSVATGGPLIDNKFTPPPGTPTTMKTEWDKKIVKSANLNLEVKDFKTFSRQLTEKIQRYGGYVSSEQQNTSSYKMESVVTLRVPVDKFDAAMDEILKDAATVNVKTINAEDQTREYIDSKSRLEAKKQVRLRYLELLKQAKNMSEIIEVQQEINSIQEEIEVVSGRINQINLTAAMSTIHLTYFQVLNGAVEEPSQAGFFSRLLDAFTGGWKWLGEVLIGLSSIWPLLLIFIVGGLFIRRKLLTKKIA